MIPAPAEVRATGRAHGPGRWRALAATATAAASISALGGCGGSPAPSAGAPLGERPLPGFLHHASPAPDAPLQATASAPALAIQGQGVVAHLAGGATVRIDVVGPALPAATPGSTVTSAICTWTVSFRSASGPVDLTAAQWSVRDSLGHLTTPHVPPGAPAPPPQVQPGQVVQFVLQAVEPLGEGVVRWAPAGPPLAAWDYIAEVN